MLKLVGLFCLILYFIGEVDSRQGNNGGDDGRAQPLTERYEVKEGYGLWARSVFRLRRATAEECERKCDVMRARCSSFEYNKRHRACFGRREGAEVYGDDVNTRQPGRGRHRRQYVLRRDANYDLYLKIDEASKRERNHQWISNIKSTDEPTTTNNNRKTHQSTRATTTQQATTTRRPTVATRRIAVPTESNRRTERPTTTAIPTTTRETTTRRRRTRPTTTTRRPTTSRRTRPTTRRPTTSRRTRPTTTTRRPTTSRRTRPTTTTRRPTTSRRTRPTTTTGRPTTSRRTRPTTTRRPTTSRRTRPTTTRRPTTTTELTTTTRRRTTTRRPTTSRETTTRRRRTRPTTTTRRPTTTTRRTTRPTTTTESTTRRTTTTGFGRRRTTTTTSTGRVTNQTTRYNRDRSCTAAIGIESKDIPNDWMTASSYYLFNYASNARLNAGGAWVPLTTEDEWLEISMPEPLEISGIAVQGSYSYFVGSKYVSTYQVYYQNTAADESGSLRLKSDRYGNSEIAGPTDGSEVARNDWEETFFADKIRIVPLTWEGGIQMRVELYTPEPCP